MRYRHPSAGLAFALSLALLPRVASAQTAPAPAPYDTASPTKPPPPKASPKADAPDDADVPEEKGPDAPSPPSGKPKADPDDAAMEEEIVDEESPSRPPPKGKGVVWGVVRGGLENDTLVEASVTVVGQKTRALTDVDGQFRLVLPPGTYDLRVFYELHKARRVQNVRVAAGAVVRFDVLLDADKKAEEEVTAVEIDAERSSAAAQLVMRRNSATASDAISAQDIARTPDRNAAEAAKRVVGASIVDSKYVFVRGLGERYTNSLLNGTPIPSPEPDRNAIPLDLFPALVLSDITVMKTFSPDLPGDFAGGSVIIHTRDLPSKFTLQSTVSLGANTVTTFQKRLSYEGGSRDWLGMDDGTRAIPDDIPDSRIVRIGRDGTINPNIVQYGRSLNTPMNTKRTLNLPSGAASVILGDSLHFGASNPHVLGYQAAASYSRRFTRRVDETVRTFTVDPTTPGKLLRLNDYNMETGVDNVAWSGLGTLTYAYGSHHKLAFTGVYSRAGEVETRHLDGLNEERASRITDTRLRFTSRLLAFAQLRGEHRAPKLTTGTLSWSATFSRATLNEPDTRENIYNIDSVSGPNWTEGTLSGLHFFSRQQERAIGGSLDWTQPLLQGKNPVSVKVGGLLNLKHRYFEARRFRFTRLSGVDATVFNLPAERLFTNENIGTALNIEEYTRPNDAYVADHNVFAGYLLSDVVLHPNVRLVLGGRVEASTQTIDSFDPYAADNAPVRAQLARTDLLPSANLIFKPNDKSNVRLSISRTVARPQLRELAPFAFTDYFGARELQGNPNLDRTRIVNADLRYEFFPGVSEVLAATAFFKSFEMPIEQVIIPTTLGVTSFANAKGATNYGVELEGRKNLGFLHSAASDFSVIANMTLVRSRVELDPLSGGIQTNSVRPLAGQSPYIVNTALDYTNEKVKLRARILYNVFGPRIAQVGRNGLPDVYEQPRHTVDLMVAQGIGEHFDIRGTAENIFNSPVRFTQGEEAQGEHITNRYVIGTTAWLNLTYTN